MKVFFRFLLGAIVLLVLLLTVLYFVVGPVSYETRFEADRPASVTWALLTDGERATEWLPGLQSMELIDGEPLSVGSRMRLTFVEDGSEIVMEETLTAVVPERELSFALTHEIIDSDVTIRLEEAGGRTTVVTENEVRGKGIVKLVVPLLKASMVQRQDEGYARLKALIEAEAVPGTAPETGAAPADPDEG